MSQLDDAGKKEFREADLKEWQAWQDLEACETMIVEESERIRKERPDLIIPMKWIRTDKDDVVSNDGLLAKSHIVVQGFRDKRLGLYRGDAPTASKLDKSVVLLPSAALHVTLACGDDKNAYFHEKDIGREISVQQPRGGLPGLNPRQLPKALKAIYGFAKSARLFWLALKEMLENDGWVRSLMEPALFFLRSGALGIQIAGQTGSLCRHSVHPCRRRHAR